MKLSQLKEEIEKQTKYANDTLEDATPQTKNGREGRKRAATVKLKELKALYKQRVRPNIYPILVTGPQNKEFAEVAKNSEAALLSVDYLGLYKKIGERFSKDLLSSNRTNSMYVLDATSLVLEEVAREVGVYSYPQITFKAGYTSTLKTKEEVALLAQRIVEEQVGSEFNSLAVIDAAAELAYGENFFDEIYPIIITVDNSKDLETAVLSLKKYLPKTVTINTGFSDVKADLDIKEINEENVLKTLNKTKKMLKNK